MCGIAGIFTNQKEVLNSINISEVKDLMKNRGPDYFGSFEFYLEKKFLKLYSSRLKILDLNDNANQPYFYKNYVLIFNGEIYNYIELKERLRKKGYSFQTSSDTEVLIKSFDCWKENCVNYFEGMWSFAIFDKKKGSLFLSRDPFGEKPLFYFKDNNNFVFGSEIKFIFNLYKNTFLKKINYRKIQNYLSLGHKSLNTNDETFFSKIKKLTPGSNIFLNTINNKFIKKTFFDKKILFKNTDYKFKSFEDYYLNVRETLEKSLQLRLRADVKIAFCLSGGVDSSGLVSIAKKKFNMDTKCYSIIDRDERYNEEKNIKTLEENLKLNLKKIYIQREEEFFENLNDLIKYHDSPISTISYYAHSKISKAASEDGYKVILSGTGADEIFSGYYDHYLFHLNKLNRVNKDLFMKEKECWKKFVKPLTRNKLLTNEKYIFDRELKKHIFLNENISKKYLKFSRPKIPQEKLFFTHNKLKNRMANELFHEIVPVILHEDDLNSMFYSLENRSPYLDKDLIRLSFSAPNNYMINNGLAKYTLRNALKDYVPKKVLFDRKKVGFNWSLNSLPSKTLKKIYEFLNDNEEIDELINKKELNKLIKKKEYSNSENKILFSILNIKLFMSHLNE